MTTTSRVVQHDVPGGPDVLHVREVEVPRPSIGEVLVRVHAAGVNPVDSMNRAGGAFGRGAPFGCGYDVSGVVAAVGPGVTLWAPGDEVVGMLPFPFGLGAYADHVVAPARALVRKPAALTHVEAGALPLAGLTAWQALVDTADVRHGTRLLVTGAAGGVGHLAVQIAHARGAHVVAVASAEDAALVRRLGADEVLDYRTADAAETVRDVDVVLDVLGAESATRHLACLRPGGIAVITLPQQLAELAPATSEAGCRAAALFVEADQVGMLGLTELVRDGRLRPLVAATYPLEQAGTAQSARHGAGKVVLVTGA